MDIFDGMVAELRDHLPHHHHDVPVIPPIPTTQENPVTTPQQPLRATASLVALASEIDANRLASALIENNLGSLLTANEVSTVLTSVDFIERPRRNAPPVPQNDGAQQP